MSETTLASGSFGTVTSKRVIYNRAKNWFSGGSREDIPLKHVTSVRLETSRSLVGGIVLLIIGLSFFNISTAGTEVMAAILVIVGALMLWGSPSVVVNTAGRDTRGSKGFPWQRAEANVFVEAIRQQLVRE